MVEKTWLAPAKINLCLHVLGKRSDGYHDVAMLMQRVSLFDRITLAVTDEPGVRVSCAELPLASGEENIAGRAATRMLELSSGGLGVSIQLEKIIPVAAGLGGGSSDAATVLMALNELLRLGLSRQALMDVGVTLGADVPFFIFESTAWATGIGERLETVPMLADVWYVLVNPGVSVSTAQVYRKLELTSGNDLARLPRFSGTLDALAGQLHNDLERVTLKDFPVVAEIKELLVSLGAAGALMSGSGPTVFGIFRTEAAARTAARELERSPGWRVFVVQPV